MGDVYIRVIKYIIMIRQETIAYVIDAQKTSFLNKNIGLIRDSLKDIPVADSFATIITGIRRCGKSTLLLQLLRRDYENAVYLNFDDIRLAGFEREDLSRLLVEIQSRAIEVLFFDEIQVVEGWEIFVNQLLREEYKVFITGSNASMLSVELGTHLTGRHLSMELFPFSYNEFVRLKGVDANENTIMTYLEQGGIPEYVKTGISLVITTLLDDILVKDIAVRNSIKDVNSLRQLAIFLVTNIGNLVSANKLVGMFGIKSGTTFLEYFSFLQDSYLLEFIPKYNYSLKVQARNPKKVYVMDVGIYTENCSTTSENLGRRLENLVFLHLRRKYKEIFYFHEQGECDFVAIEKSQVKELIQVCLHVTDENFQREYNGLLGAMKYFNVTTGIIVTLNQSETIYRDGQTIKMVKANDFFCDEI